MINIETQWINTKLIVKNNQFQAADVTWNLRAELLIGFPSTASKAWEHSYSFYGGILSCC